MSRQERQEGLLHKYVVRRAAPDPWGKHDECRYFVLDPQHDPIARVALQAYQVEAEKQGYLALAADLHAWLTRVVTA